MLDAEERRRPRRCGVARPQGGTAPHYIFISYRWRDSFAHARLLADELGRRFGEARVFLDTKKIQGGDRIDERIESAIQRADQFLLVIGDRWLTSGENGRNQLEDPTDWVRQEIELARALNVRLIPVLVHDADMPRAQDLPGPIQWISYRKADVLHDSQIKLDLAELAGRLHKRRPRNRFAPLEELGSLASTRALVWNAIAKPCAIVFSLAIASLALFVHPAVLDPWIFVVIGAATYVLLTLTSFFTLAEAEWVGSRDAQRRAKDVEEPTIA